VCCRDGIQQQPHIIDIGGSTELVLGDGHEPRSLSSKVGAVRLNASPPTQSATLSFSTYKLCVVRWSALLRIWAALLEDECPVWWEPLAIESLATIHAREGSVPSPLTGYDLSLKDLRELVLRLRKLSYSERAEIPGMSERRSEIILAGAVILKKR